MGNDQVKAEIRAEIRFITGAMILVASIYVLAIVIDLLTIVSIGVKIDKTVFSDPFRFARLLGTMATSATVLVIFVALIFRYKAKHKLAPLLLSSTFGFFTAGYVVYWFKMIFKFIVPITEDELLIQEMMDNGIWLLLLPGALFLLFFVFEVFEGGLNSKKNSVPVRLFSIFLIACFTLIVLSVYNNHLAFFDKGVMNILLYVGFALGLFTFLYIFLVQAISAFKIVAKTTDNVQRTGIIFIGLSGLLFTANIVLELLEQLSRALDLGIEGLTNILSVIGTFLTLAGAITVYVGYIYPTLRGGQPERAP
nr:hypothetical protein [Candidatus Sigynarchaeota archaeon]